MSICTQAVHVHVSLPISENVSAHETIPILYSYIYNTAVSYVYIHTCTL